MLVVYRFNSADESNEALIVNISEKVAGLPNSSKDDFFLIGDYLLFQSESGGAYVPFESGKFDQNDPNYLFEPNYIKFISPYPSPSHTLEIVLKD
ncbi:MAG TPA: hypothetical protein PKA82_02950 [Pyrinomonadaceae bacterium]|nr:hypothetical protein [Pyrinomonadaceae bacterium]